jgi:hypothetical protein
MSIQPPYIASNRCEDSPTDAVAIHCSDHRFQTGFREFLIDGLKLDSYALLSVPGGGHFLSLELYMPKFTKANLQSLSFLIKRTSARRIILIGHSDCLFFRDRAEFLFAEKEFDQKQTASLRAARNRLLERFPLSSVELYFARADADGVLAFIKAV